MNLRILFVDDEPNVINGLRRSLHSMKSEWDMYFALSGAEALELMKNTPIDLVVSDMRMPEMNGAVLLGKVKELYPTTIRIILSGYSDQDLILEASNTSHQFLAKPLDAMTLKEVIKKLYSYKSILKNCSVESFVAGIRDLPSLPDLYLQIEKEIKKSSPSIKQIDNIISKDVVMTAKILQVVNSAFFGLPQRIVSPLEAINFLGIEVIKALVLMVNFFIPADEAGEPKGDFALLWKNSILTAKKCRQIAEYEKLNSSDIDIVFTAGTLHDIGKIIIWQIDNYFQKIKQFGSGANTITDAEYTAFKISHAEVGAYLLGIWGLPDVLVNLLLYHHSPSKFPEENKKLISILHTGNHLATGEPLDEYFLSDSEQNKIVNKWIMLFKGDPQ